jgi:isoleucyl-tRNA synthetase
MLAPILVFTAEEAWGYLGRGGSIHLQEFPALDPERRDEGAERAVDQLLKLRGVIGQAIEQARQEKLIGNALEAAVVLRGDTAAIRNLPKEELEEFFILSDLTLEQAETTSASISKTPHQKCARCWRHRATVGQSFEHPDLCDRCESVVAERLARTAK